MNEPTVISIFFVVFFGLVFIVYNSSKSKKGSFIDRFTDKIIIVTGFLAAIGIYLTYQIFKAQSDKMANEITTNLNDSSWLNINKLIASSQETCPNLVNSLYFPWQREALGSNQNVQGLDNWADCNYLSTSIFQAWENFLTLVEYDETGNEVWVSTFLQNASSDILRNHWTVLKNNYAETTREFGDLLFNAVSNYMPKNETEQLSLSKNIVHSEEFKIIRNKRTTHTVII